MGQALRRGIARHRAGLLQLGADLLGERLDRLPAVQALDQLGGERGDLLAPLLLDGIGLHLGLHRLVGLLLLGRDGQHIDPGIAAVAELGGVGLDAGRPGERRLRDLGRLGMLDRRLAVAGLAVAVDLGDLAEGKLQAPAPISCRVLPAERSFSAFSCSVCISRLTRSSAMRSLISLLTSS